ncbi:hypothetical protein F5I97DRAFT_1878095 [Phlebopus sp. FC_14]|nr:hypothetical protein F5I97DRAFT_1878095 [Phlebopus sp. FC_14]
MGFFTLVRIIVLTLTMVFSVVVLGLAAHLIWLTDLLIGSYFIFAALAIAAAGLSLVTLPIMLIVDCVRRGAFTSMIVVELVWLFILWVLWVATAAEAVVSTNIEFPVGCIYPEEPTINQACHEFQAIEAFSFLNFILLFVYQCSLLTLAIVAASRGNQVWTSSVKDSNFSAPDSQAPQHPMGQYTGTPAPQPPQMPQPHYGTPVQSQYTGSTVPSQLPYSSASGGHTRAIPV